MFTVARFHDRPQQTLMQSWQSVSRLLSRQFRVTEDTMRPNKTLEPTRVGAFSSAVAGDTYWSRVAQLCR